VRRTNNKQDAYQLRKESSNSGLSRIQALAGSKWHSAFVVPGPSLVGTPIALNRGS
jgi:hypothetical protein